MKEPSFYFLIGLFLIALSPFTCFAQNNDGWQDLFNGKNLDGWNQLGGEATYEIRNGTIVGTTRSDTPNSFLCTAKNYDNFILEFEVWADAALNSGVQFRSLSSPDYQNGRVHGYQAELDPSPRAYSGGIYDEGRRKWIYPLAQNPRGQEAYQVGMWNQYRIEAIGPEIRIWVNGIQTANLVDDMTPSGFIALQVHSIKEEELAGREIQWRKIRIKTSALEEERWPVAPYAPEINLIPNTLTEHEKRTGWRLLWDGETTNGWRSARGPEFPSGGWEIKDGTLSVLAAGGEESANGGDIITQQKFSDFELKVEFKITEGANSGIKYFVDPELNKGPGSSIGLEYQILDDNNHPDAKLGVKGNRTLASLYDLIPASNLSVPDRGKEFRGIDTWNQARIVVRGNHVEHWLNGFKMMEYERNTQMFRALVAYSKYSVWPQFGELPQGHILLQDHGDQVSFRSIKVREL